MCVFTGIISLTIPISFFAGKKIDKNRDGKISSDEVTFLNKIVGKPVECICPSLHDVSIMSLARILVEAMAHAFCYGSLVVFSMNFLMSNMNRRYAYLVTIYMVTAKCVIMCKLSTNGIHICTSHDIHFFYYGFGFIPLAFFWWPPEKGYLIAITAIWTLLCLRLGKHIYLPDYPNYDELCDMYALDEDTEEWKLYSRAHEPVELVDQSLDAIEPAFNKQAITFPTYEILNTHISSSVTVGILTGLVTSNIVGAFANTKVVSDKSLAISVLVAIVVINLIQIFGLYGRAEKKMHSDVLARFYPKTIAVVFAVFGAASIVIQLDPRADIPSDDNGTPIVTYWVGVTALIAAFLISIVESIIAKYYQRLSKRFNSTRQIRT